MDRENAKPSRLLSVDIAPRQLGQFKSAFSRGLEVIGTQPSAISRARSNYCRHRRRHYGGKCGCQADGRDLWQKV